MFETFGSGVAGEAPPSDAGSVDSPDLNVGPTGDAPSSEPRESNAVGDTTGTPSTPPADSPTE